MNDPTQSYCRLLQALDNSKDDADAFIAKIQEENTPHLSFSRIYTVEMCERRYVLQYIIGIQPEPIPDSLEKGKAFHRMAAAYYRSNSVSASSATLLEVCLSAYGGQNQQHLRNVVEVFLHSTWSEYEVMGVEKAFVMPLGDNLPPLVGVIDLILRKGSDFVVVDHKTGRDFYQPEAMQMAIYYHYLQSVFDGNNAMSFYYDHYRWVQSNARARKPLFQRMRVAESDLEWQPALKRIRDGYARIVHLENGGRAKTGELCFMCPYRQYC